MDILRSMTGASVIGNNLQIPSARYPIFILMDKMCGVNYAEYKKQMFLMEGEVVL